MAGQKIQITIPEKMARTLQELCEKKGYSKSQIVAMAIDKMAIEEKGESDEKK